MRPEMKKPQRVRDARASNSNVVNDQEENVMSKNTTAQANVIPFDFGNRQVRAMLIDDQPWFVAADVSDALEYRDAANMARNLDGDEKGTQIVSTLGGDQEMLLINESGLYSAILRSRKAEAKRFKKWVTAEVLPAIRKHGRYEDAGDRMSTLLGQTIGTDGFHMLGALIKGKVAGLPSAVQRRATAKLWSQTHAAFGVRSAADIPADQLDAARNFVAAYAIDGEWIGRASAHGTMLTDKQLYEVFLVSHHFSWVSKIFRKYNLYAHLTGLGCRAGVEMIDHFKDGSTALHNLKELNREFDAVQRRLGLNQYRENAA